MQIEKLAGLGFLSEQTPVYITHLSSIVAYKHHELQGLFNQFDFNYILSYDGLTFEFEGR